MPDNNNDASVDKASGDVDPETVPAPEPSKPEPPKVPDVELIVDGFGFMPSEATKVKPQTGEEEKSPCASSTNIDIVRRYTWKTRNRMTVQLISYGATITSISVPNKLGVSDDIVAGFDTLEEYFQKTNPYFGATIGRYANYIADGTMNVRPAGRMYMLSINRGNHHYHGGHLGFDKNCMALPLTDSLFKVDHRFITSASYDLTALRTGAELPVFASYIDCTYFGECAREMFDRPMPHHFTIGTFRRTAGYHPQVNWRSYVTGNKVIMSHVSERFHEGYPGTLMTQISFEVTCDNTIQIMMKCTTSEPTVVNLSHSLYFNLAGHHVGRDQMYEHIVTINADKYTPTCDDGIVSGEKKVVGGTAYDFRVPRLIRAMLPKIPMGGYDVNYCITKGVEQDLTFQARAVHPLSGRVIEVYSNQPGMQFYTGNDLPDPNKLVEGLADEEEKRESVSPRKQEESSVSSVDEEFEEEGLMEEEHHHDEQGKPDPVYVPLKGKGGTTYNRHGLFCMMPQNYPDAVNHKNFPNSVLNPGEVYIHKIEYKFGLLLGRYV